MNRPRSGPGPATAPAPWFLALGFIALAGCCCLLPRAGAAAAISVTDDSGRIVELPQPARRIVSLAPHVTELLFSAGAGDRIVGTVRGSDFPAAASRLPDVGDAHSLDLERIVALMPDLVVAWQSGNGATALDRLRQLGFSVYVSEPANLAGIAATLRALGRLAGTESVADGAAGEFDSRQAKLARRHAGANPIRVFYQIWNDPIFTVNRDHVISEIIDLCGGINVFAGMHALAGEVDLESVLAAQPEIIVGSGVDASRPAWLDYWRQWPELPAVRSGNIAFIPPDLIQRHSVRILDGAEMMCDILEAARRKR